MTEQKSIETYVNEYIKHHKEQPLMDIACEVADIILHDLHPNIQHWVESLYEPNTTVFNEASQKLYDAIYDEVFAYLEEKYNA